MATREYRVPAGGNLADASGYSWQIGGVAIDNPSGFWLEVLNVGIVPPYVLGWALAIIPSKTSLSVRSLAQSPSGSLSPGGGSAYIVTISDTEVVDSPGRPSGSLALTTQLGQDYLRGVASAIGANEAGSTSATLFTVPAGQRASVVAISAAYRFDSANPNAHPRTIVTIAYLVNGVGVPLFVLNISPASPADERQFPPGLIIITAGQTLDAMPVTVVGGGEQQIFADAIYYLETVPIA